MCMGSTHRVWQGLPPPSPHPEAALLVSPAHIHVFLLTVPVLRVWLPGRRVPRLGTCSA